MNNTEIGEYIAQVGIVPVVRAPSPELAVRAAQALLEGGVSVLEITMTVPDAVSVVALLCARFAERALVGAGTVLSAAQAEACLDAGARFIVSPGLDLDTVAAVRARGALMLPGALTPTEVMAAVKAGADMVKIFPVSAAGGPSYLRALRGPLPHVKLLPTGGVSLATAPDYIAAGAVALGIGTELVDMALLAADRDDEITLQARKFTAAVRTAREALNPSRSS